MLYSQKQVNLHTHTLFSHHGSGMPKDYLEKAKDGGNIRVLGFSEHGPLNYSFPYARMDGEEASLYVKSVRDLCDDKIVTLLGFECDWRDDLYSFYEDEYLSRYKSDYLLGSVHYLKNSEGDLIYIGNVNNKDFLLSDYVDLYCSMLSSRLFLYGCHPDLFVSSFTSWTEDLAWASKDIISCAKEYDIPLEINGNGMGKKKVVRDGVKEYIYPKREFWALAKESGVKIVCSSDAHTTSHLDSYIRCENFATELGIEFSSYFIDEKKREVKII